MIKKILGILTIAGLIVSCGTPSKKEEQKSETKIAEVTPEQVLADLPNFVEKEVSITGTVNHVCTHGGKRMFIIGKENPDAAIKITPNDEIGAFERELEGSNVTISGVVKELRIDEAYVANLEKEIAGGTDNEAIHDHSNGTHNTEAENEQKAQIDAMKEQIASSENGYYSQYWIEASKFKVNDEAIPAEADEQTSN